MLGDLGQALLQCIPLFDVDCAVSMVTDQSPFLYISGIVAIQLNKGVYRAC